MSVSYAKIKRLFLRQSYLDAWEDYMRSLRKPSFIHWDYVILTAGSENQAEVYRKELEYRLSQGFLPDKTEYAVLSDPEGKRVGSGGATLNVLRYLTEKEGKEVLQKRILVIHSGGDSKRVPQYSVCGKLFSPVPRELPDGRASTLFDEFLICCSGIPGRMQGGMLVMSGDVLLLFNALQIDIQYHGAAAISIKESVETGKNHGVFLADRYGSVRRFLHKQPVDRLQSLGAVNEQGNVNLDTGAVMLDPALLEALFSLISTEGKNDAEKFDEFVNDRARISFYGDFLYPLAKDSSLEAFYAEAPEGEFCKELMECRTKIWDALRKYGLKVICLSPAEFIHFGTTKELMELVGNRVDDYEFLDWKKQVCSNRPMDSHYAAHNSMVEEGAVLGEGAYIENSRIEKNSYVGESTIVSCLQVQGEKIPADLVLHGLKLQGKKEVVRIYGVEDNPKGRMEDAASYLYGNLREIVDHYRIPETKLWDGAEHDLWNAKLFPVCETGKQALEESLALVRISRCEEADAIVEQWLKKERISLSESFQQAETSELIPWKENLRNEILIRRFLKKLEDESYYEDALSVFGKEGIDTVKYRMLLKEAEDAELFLRLRIYYALSRYMKNTGMIYEKEESYDIPEKKCFGELAKAIYENCRERIADSLHSKIMRDEVRVELPVRVNWGGGWTDTPPYCMEKGGTVLNAAVRLNGCNPVQVEIRKLPEKEIRFASEDIGVSGVATTMEEVRDCRNPFDLFALHKAALIACGVIPLSGEGSLQELLDRLGGGIYLSTKVIGIPKGSGLGTSSILAGACVRAIYEFLGLTYNQETLFEIVLCMEQIMSTGGGWQDQVGGLIPGIKFISSQAGLEQHLWVEPVQVSVETRKELQERFALIYTGQRRLARNLLREVVGNYIGRNPRSVQALGEMKQMPEKMRKALHEGNIEELAVLFNRHWELSVQLDSGCTNTCIEQIFLSCEDMIDGRFIAGAGGGGFLQVILKKGITKSQLSERLREVFQDNGVDVWSSEFVWE